MSVSLARQKKGRSDDTVEGTCLPEAGPQFVVKRVSHFHSLCSNLKSFAAKSSVSNRITSDEWGEIDSVSTIRFFVSDVLLPATGSALAQLAKGYSISG